MKCLSHEVYVLTTSASSEVLKESATGRILKSLGCLHTKSMDVGKGPGHKLTSNPAGFVSIGKGQDHKLTSNPTGYVSMGIY